MSEKIEQVAEAIRKVIGTCPSAPPGIVWEGLMEQAAIAAIDVMRPTPKPDNHGFVWVAVAWVCAVIIVLIVGAILHVRA